MNPRRIPVVTIAILIISASAVLLRTPAEANAPMVRRWAEPFSVLVPADWTPMLERNSTGFIRGRQPSKDSFSPFIAVMLGFERVPKSGYEGLLSDIERSFSKDAHNFRSSRSQVRLGDLDAAELEWSAEAKVGNVFRPMSGRIAITTEAVRDGFHAMFTLMGDDASMKENAPAAESLVASVSRDVPPFGEVRSIPYLEPNNDFRHIRGAGIDDAGRVALGASDVQGVKLFATDGSLTAYIRKTGEERPFNAVAATCSRTDGAILVLDDAYGQGYVVHELSPDGATKRRIPIARDVFGEKRFSPSQIVPLADGGFALAGDPSVFVFDGGGKFVRSFATPGLHALAALPDGSFAAAVIPGEGTGSIRILDAKGIELRSWGRWGSSFETVSSDSFRPKHIAADGRGRIVAIDDDEDVLIAYDASGTLGHFMKIRSFGLPEALAANGSGSICLVARPSSGSTTQASAFILENAWKGESASSGPIVPDDAGTRRPESDPGSLSDVELDAEIERCTRALELRERGAALQDEGKLAEAIAAFGKSLELFADPALERHIALLKAASVSPTPEPTPEPTSEPTPVPSPTVTPTPLPTRDDAAARADRLRSEGILKQKEGRLYDALVKYRESLALNPDPELSAYADRLEKILRDRARKLVATGMDLQKKKRYAEAMKAYRDSLGVFPDPMIVEHVRKLGEYLESLDRKP